jgi:hypothetical protein
MVSLSSKMPFVHSPWVRFFFNYHEHYRCLFVCLMVFNATFNNISVISWRSVLLVKETRGTGENHSLSQVTYKLYHINVVHLALISGDA